jgi:hypothetical protein
MKEKRHAVMFLHHGAQSAAQELVDFLVVLEIAKQKTAQGIDDHHATLKPLIPSKSVLISPDESLSTVGVSLQDSLTRLLP